MADRDEYKPKNLLLLLPDLAKQKIFDSFGNSYNAMDVITSAVAQLRPDVSNGLGLLSHETAIELMLEAEHRGLFSDGTAFAAACKLMELRDGVTTILANGAKC